MSRLFIVEYDLIRIACENRARRSWAVSYALLFISVASVLTAILVRMP